MTSFLVTSSRLAGSPLFYLLPRHSPVLRVNCSVHEVFLASIKLLKRASAFLSLREGLHMSFGECGTRSAVGDSLSSTQRLDIDTFWSGLLYVLFFNISLDSSTHGRFWRVFLGFMTRLHVRQSRFMGSVSG